MSNIPSKLFKILNNTPIFFLIVISILLQSNCSKDNCYNFQNKKNSVNESIFDKHPNSNNVEEKHISLTRPSLVMLKSWECPSEWNKIIHNEIKSGENTFFSWCEPPDLPLLKVNNYLTQADNNEEREKCEPLVDGMFPVLGKSKPQLLGESCPEEIWQDLGSQSDENIIYVNSEFSGVEHGTTENPYTTLTGAVTAASDDDVILLSKGKFNESVKIDKNLTIIGSCVKNTVVEATGPHEGMYAGTFIIENDVNLVLKNLRISGSQNGIFINSENAYVEVDGIWVHEATRYGILILKGRLVANKILVDSTQLADDGTRGRGLGMALGYYDVTIKNSIFENNYDYGIKAARANNSQEPLGKILLENIIVRGTKQRTSSQVDGRGLNVTNGPEIKIKKSLFDNNFEFGIAIEGEGTTAIIEDTIVQNTNANVLDGTLGAGMKLANQATVTLKRCLIKNNTSSGIISVSQGDYEKTNLTIQDTIVLNTNSQNSDQTKGFGIEVQNKVNLTASRLLIEKNRSVGLIIFGDDISADVTDIIVRETLPEEKEPQLFGWGMFLEGEIDLTIEGGLVENNYDNGIVIDGDLTKISADSLIVQNTKSKKNVFIGGRGVNIQNSQNIDLKNTYINNNHDVGLFLSANSFVNLNNVEINNTKKLECAVIDSDPLFYCSYSGSGYGLGVYSDSTANFTNFKIINSASIGVQIARSGAIYGQDIEVSNNNIGFNIQKTKEGYEFSENVKGLIMRNNQINFHTQTLDVPDLVEFSTE